VKVLIFLTQFYQLGGAELSVVELAEELNKRRIHADILSMYTEALPGVTQAKAALLQKGIPTVHFLGMRIHPSIASMVQAIMKLRRLIRENEYDIIETSMVLPTVLAAWATRGMRVQHVAGLRSIVDRDRHNKYVHEFRRFSVRYSRRIRYYAISESAASHWITFSKTSPQHTRIIYNSIPDVFFSVTPDREGVRKELGMPKVARLVIYVGRCAAFKGIDTLLDALGPVLEQYNMYLLYVGLPDLSVPGTKEMLQKMEMWITQENLSERVRFLGHRKDVPRLLAASDLLVHPTRTEAFGRVLAEAISAGLPVVASNVDGIPEVLAGTDSLMVPPDDPNALREAVLKTLNRTPEEATRAVEKGRKRAEAFRIDKRTDAMIRLFEDVLAGRF